MTAHEKVRRLIKAVLQGEAVDKDEVIVPVSEVVHEIVQGLLNDSRQILILSQSTPVVGDELIIK